MDMGMIQLVIVVVLDIAFMSGWAWIEHNRA